MLIQKFNLQRSAISFLFKNCLLIEFKYLLIRYNKTKCSLWNIKNTNRNSINQQNIHTTQRYEDNFRKGYLVLVHDPSFLEQAILPPLPPHPLLGKVQKFNFPFYKGVGVQLWNKYIMLTRKLFACIFFKVCLLAIPSLPHICVTALKSYIWRILKINWTNKVLVELKDNFPLLLKPPWW